MDVSLAFGGFCVRFMQSQSSWQILCHVKYSMHCIHSYSYIRTVVRSCSIVIILDWAAYGHDSVSYQVQPKIRSTRFGLLPIYDVVAIRITIWQSVTDVANWQFSPSHPCQDYDKVPSSDIIWLRFIIYSYISKGCSITRPWICFSASSPYTPYYWHHLCQLPKLRRYGWPLPLTTY
jgi:hypothetical protein